VTLVDVSQVTQAQLSRGAVDEERVRDGHVELRVNERRQVISALRVADEHVHVVDTTSSQTTDIDARPPRIHDELSTGIHQ